MYKFIKIRENWLLRYFYGFYEIYAFNKYVVTFVHIFILLSNFIDIIMTVASYHSANKISKCFKMFCITRITCS